MPNSENSVFKDVERKTKIKAVPLKKDVSDIDTSHSIYDLVDTAAQQSTIDLSAITSFTSVSQARDSVYNMIDVMSEDPIISTALNIYSSDVCEPNEKGDIVWVESDNVNAAGEVSYLLDKLGVNKRVYGWAHSLIKYGDLYLKLFKNSELGIEQKDNGKLNEDVILKMYNNNDHFGDYIESQRNPAEIFDLQRFGKTVGYIKTHITPTEGNDTYTFRYDFNRGDVDVYAGDAFVHACLEDNSTRFSEEVCINAGEEDKSKKVIYSVKRGQSILYNLFRIWRELSLLENSVMLNRITRSALTRIVTVEVADMDPTEAKNLLHRIKSMIEQKSAINLGTTYEEYTNPGPVQNTIYVPKHGEVGGIQVQDLGGNVEQGDLVDLDYFRNKLFGALGIPKQYLGVVDDAAGFSGGESLALISANYGKNIKRIQAALCQCIADAINLLLLDKGLIEYIDAFTIKMQAPTTKEEKDRKENITSTLGNIRETMGLINEVVEDTKPKLVILKSMLSSIIGNDTVSAELQSVIDSIEAGEEAASEEPMSPMDSEEPMGPAPMEGEEPTEGPTEMEPEEPEETEDETLPTFDDLGVSFNDAG